MLSRLIAVAILMTTSTSFAARYVAKCEVPEWGIVAEALEIEWIAKTQQLHYVNRNSNGDEVLSGHLREPVPGVTTGAIVETFGRIFWVSIEPTQSSFGHSVRLIEDNGVRESEMICVVDSTSTK